MNDNEKVPQCCPCCSPLEIVLYDCIITRMSVLPNILLYRGFFGISLLNGPNDIHDP